MTRSSKKQCKAAPSRASAGPPDAPAFSVEEIERVWQEYDRRCNEKVNHVRFFSEDKWLTSALVGDVPGMKPTDRDILFSVRGVGASVLGHYWTGLLVIDPEHRNGHAWFNEINGIVPIEADLHVFEGDGTIPGDTLDKLLILIDRKPLQTFQSVPEDVYDGTPLIIKSCYRRNPQIHVISVNAANTTGGDTLTLAGLLCRIRADTSMVETQRFPASDG